MYIGFYIVIFNFTIFKLSLVLYTILLNKSCQLPVVYDNVSLISSDSCEFFNLFKANLLEYPVKK